MRYALRKFMIVAAVLMIGCSPTKSVIKTFTFSEPLRKKAAIVPFLNKTFIGDADVRQMFQIPVMAYLEKECSNTFFLKPDSPGFPSQLLRLPRHQVSGGVDNLTLIQQGRKAGINAIIIVRVLDIEAIEKEKGLLFFQDTHYFENVRINVTIFNTETGAKLLDESLTYETEVDGTEFDAVKAADAKSVYEVSNAFEYLSEQAGQKICSVLNAQPWRTYVISAAEDEIILPSGREVNLKLGDILDVYEKGKIIKGRYGEQFLIPGPKVGEVKIMEVYVGKAKAKAILNQGIQPDCTLRPR